MATPGALTGASRVPLAPGERLGRYVIRDELGRGGMGVVFRAHDTVLDREVAIKLVAALGRDAERTDRARLMREARAAAAVSHPNVVAVFDVGEVDEIAFVAMELVDGSTLRAFVGDAGVPMERRLRWLVEIARALDAGHARGVVHRDVKPENVMVRSDGIAKVLDFGIARFEARDARAAITAPGAVLGTPRYMAPEQMRGEPIDARADQFSWGVVAYELVTGALPWGRHGGGLLDVAEMMVRAPEPPESRNAEIDPRVARVILRAVAPSPRDRMESMAAVLEALASPREPSLGPPIARRAPAAREIAAAPAPGAVATLASWESAERGVDVDPKTLPPLLAGRYAPRRLVGRGGMGVVYEVEHVQTGERWALKLLHAHVARDPVAIGRFRREARVASQVKSEHVVRIIDADVAPELGGAPFMVMDLLDGANLAELAGEEPQPPPRVVEWLRQAAAGLARAHARGIVHRDLKPANLFVARRLDGSWIVKVLDFGIAKAMETHDAKSTLAGAVIGTPLYMSPEQAGNDPAAVTWATDVWACGILAFRLLSGRDYWTGSVAQVLASIVHDPVVAPSRRGLDLGPAFDAWFLRACARDPAERFGGTSEQMNELAAALSVCETAGRLEVADLSSPAGAVMSPPPSGSSRLRAWTEWGLLAVVIVSIVIAGGLKLAGGDGRSTAVPVAPPASVAPSASEVVSAAPAPPAPPERTAAPAVDAAPARATPARPVRPAPHGVRRVPPAPSASGIPVPPPPPVDPLADPH